MKMPARRFFVMLKTSRKQEADKNNLFLADLCDVAAITMSNAETYENMKKNFISRVTGGSYKRENGTSVRMDYKDKKVVDVLSAICKQKAKLEGLRG